MRRLRVLLGVPGSGMLSEEVAQSSFHACLKHDVFRVPSCTSGPNFNKVWTTALNGDWDILAMMHTDITILEKQPHWMGTSQRWCDVGIDELLKGGYDFLSTPMAIKDIRGITATGIGNPRNRFNPWKRFTTAELESIPMTFTIDDTPYKDKFLIHSGALCFWDMRKPLWRKPNLDGTCRFIYNFTETILKVDGSWVCMQESEDWAYSRALWEAGAKTAVTRKICYLHQGRFDFPNFGDGGTHAVDEDTAPQWRGDSGRVTDVSPRPNANRGKGKARAAHHRASRLAGEDGRHNGGYRRV